MPKEPIIFEENLSVVGALYFEDFYKKLYKELNVKVLNKAKTGIKSGSLGTVRKITNKKIYEAASSCETKKEFMKKHKNLYMAACKRKIVEDLGLKRLRAKNNTYTEKYCYEIARKCKTFKELKETDMSAYSASHRENWKKQYWWLYNSLVNPVIKTKGFKIKIYHHFKSCFKGNRISKLALKTCIETGKTHEGAHYRKLNINDIEFDIPDFEHRYIV